jgi:ABC-type multidrug transport system fused ATPase/permease subunit
VPASVGDFATPLVVPLTLLLLLLGCVSSVQPSVTSFIGLAVFLHYLKQFLLRLDSVKHILAVSDPQTVDNSVNSAAFGQPERARCQLHHPVHILL